MQQGIQTISIAVGYDPHLRRRLAPLMEVPNDAEPGPKVSRPLFRQNIRASRDLKKIATKRLLLFWLLGKVL